MARRDTLRTPDTKGDYRTPYLLIHHAVEEYAKWKPVFDEHATYRKTSGSKGGRLFRSADNPNKLVILFEWDDLDKARKFTQSDDLRQAMQRAGVIGRPDLYFLEEASRVAFRRQPAGELYSSNPLLRYLFDWYYMRLIIYVTPHRILWWDHADFGQSPHEMEVSHVG